MTAGSLAWRGHSRWFCFGAVALTVMPLLGSCTDSDSETRRGPGDTGWSVEPPDASSEATPTPAPMPTATRPVARTHAALEVLSRSDLRPTSGYLSESGDLLVWWEMTGVRDRDAFRCRYPVAVTWVPHRGWRDRVRPGAVRAWLLADGMREVLPTRTGFYVSHSERSRRELRDQARGLVVDGQGRARTVRVSSATEPPKEGAIWVFCGPPIHGSCQLDPERGKIVRLPGRLSWEGTWHDQTSILRRQTSHISGTWSVDGGTTWNQFIDIWDAVPLRRGAATFAVSNGVRSSFGELNGGSFREGFTEWGPEDAAPMVQLPRSVDGYRSWQTTPRGTLVGLGRTGAYVSEGRNWHDVTRREAGRCGGFGLAIVGDYLVCGPQRPQNGPKAALELRISDDLGVTWSKILLDSVVPRTQVLSR